MKTTLRILQLQSLLVLIFRTLPCFAQPELTQPFRDCLVQGSITLYDYKTRSWTFSDTTDARRPTQPASTFKIINLLIALECKVISDEQEIVKWPGHTDTTRYGYRPDIYKDMTVAEAFRVSAGWVFIELAKRVGRARYARYLQLCDYGNGDLSEKGTDFWNFGPLAISPEGQIRFLVKVYEGRTPFSKRNTAILRKVMLTETNSRYKLWAKTGWTRIDGRDIGWWVGYVENRGTTCFFATRLTKLRSENNPAFGDCRKSITLQVLKQLQVID